MRKIKVFCGSSHPDLGAKILERLNLAASPATLTKFANQEIAIDLDVSVRGEDVFIISSGSAPHSSINDQLMELLIMVNAAKIASASRITCVIPYFPYNKQSKKKKARGAITAKLVSNMLGVAGVDHVITMDLHSSAVQGFFSRPVDNLLAEPSLVKYITTNFPDYATNGVAISKNAGAAKRVTSFADRLKIPFAMIHREQCGVSEAVDWGVDDEGEEQVGNNQVRLTLVGNVTGKTCFVLDDIIDTTGTFLDTAEHLKKCGAEKIVLLATHGILSGDAMAEIQKSPHVDSVVVTNSYPISSRKRSFDKLQIIDVSGVLAEAIRRTHNGESISYLFHTSY
ncbi:Ribose-phosphate pyrophosphokinase 2 [Nowakowskiella sp. JEL0407]|nr:Ribose-phosphate pyrophosphokinase 2 [Nowakowskiella sp. JEL0407]